MRVKYQSPIGEIYFLDLREGKNIFELLPGLVITQKDGQLFGLIENKEIELTYKGKNIPFKKSFRWNLGQVLNTSSGGAISLDASPVLDLSLNEMPQIVSVLAQQAGANTAKKTSSAKQTQQVGPQSRANLSQQAEQLEKKLRPNLMRLSRLRMYVYLVGVIHLCAIVGINFMGANKKVSPDEKTHVAENTDKIANKKRLKDRIKERRKNRRMNKISFGGAKAYPINIPSTIVSLLFLPFYYISRRKYRLEYKKIIVQEVFSAIGPSWGYSHDGKIYDDCIVSSRLFESYNIYHGDDLVSGKIEGLPFQMCEINLQRKPISGRKNKENKVFHGLFLMTHFNKNIRGETLIFPDKAQKSMGHLVGGFFQKINANVSTRLGELVQLEDLRFEREFSVYSTDQVEARYILDASTMEDFLSLRNRLRGIPFRASFVGNTLSVAIEYNRPLFEPPIWGPLVSRKSILEIMELFQTSQHVIAEINNRKLSKAS